MTVFSLSSCLCAMADQAMRDDGKNETDNVRFGSDLRYSSD
jgi:hypothetical protein